MTAPTRTIVSVADTTLDIFMDGDSDGEPLLLLHPWFGCWQFWRATMQLMPEYLCIAPDLYSPGYGSWDGIATPRGLAEAVLAGLDELGIDRIDVVGNSVGGIIAQVLAIEHPDRVGRLVLVGTGPYTGGVSPMFATEVSRWVDDPESAHRAGASRAVAVVTHSEVEPDEFALCVEMVESADPGYIGAVLKSCREIDLRPALSRIKAPTLVIRGAFDPIRSREHSEALVAGIAGSRDVEMPGTGHAPYVDDPSAFVKELREFIDPKAGPR